MCIKIYEVDPAKFVSVSGLVWQAVLKNTKERLGLLTDIGMLLMLEKGIRGGIWHSVYLFIDMQKLITNTWKIMIKIKNRHVLNTGM